MAERSDSANAPVPRGAVPWSPARLGPPVAVVKRCRRALAVVRALAGGFRHPLSLRPVT